MPLGLKGVNFVHEAGGCPIRHAELILHLVI